ncbi:head-tail connector protein [Bisgaard Taxon 10/6]|uniref:head-tail connector protein n=1 Tax=Pasteurellaceae TaxID=712 RepID=UPI00294B4F00|nr:MULTISPECIES: head-tail connector protein [Pasteurellaceae]MDG2914737.1 head-tail connector protein [Exercitatus varius]WRU39377.1 head-tail connector protein [Pasteurella multocida]
MDAKNLITLDEVKAQLNLTSDFNLDDALLNGYIVAAVEVAQKHIGKTFSNENSEQTIIFNPAIKVGCLMYIAHLYANREITTDTTQSLIPMTVSSLWDVYREPCVY